MEALKSVKSVFYTLQGEGVRSGRAAVFLRFSGCNLWSGLEEERGAGKGGCALWCDTDFKDTFGHNGGRYSPTDLAAKCREVWEEGSGGAGGAYVVCTGGEPLLQLDTILALELRKSFEVAVETNGTLPVPRGVDWVCVSPKVGAELVVTAGDELKLVYPQEGLDPAQYLSRDFKHFLLQPKAGPELKRNTALSVKYCMTNTRWRLSLQGHKVAGIP